MENGTNNTAYLTVLEELNTVFPNLNVLRQMDSRVQAYEAAVDIAKKNTGRDKLLLLVGPNNLLQEISTNEKSHQEIIATGSAAQLCETIANSAERLAAIIVKHAFDFPFYYKKVRELASAEGAIMIWDALENEFNQFKNEAKVSKYSLPDIFCFKTAKQAIWMGGKSEVMHC
jgi:glutamate-1-semialdehyde aminotransferase